MPFGLINASASYSFLVKRLLEGMQSVDNFIDDVIYYHSSKRVLEETSCAAYLTVKPSTCRSLVFKVISPVMKSRDFFRAKSLLFKNVSQPSTKKQICSFLGMVGSGGTTYRLHQKMTTHQGGVGRGPGECLHCHQVFTYGNTYTTTL